MPKKKTTEQFKQEVYNLHGRGYEVVSEYVNTYTKIEIRHWYCGMVYEVYPSKILAGRKCPYCFCPAHKTTEQFKQEIFDLVGDEYELMEEYINTDTKIDMRHKKCQTIYKVRPSDFLYGQRCPHCQESRGESKIHNFLAKNKIKFTQEYRMKTCRNKLPLAFDFAIFDNEKLKALIEYDGEQHTSAREYFGGKEELLKLKKRDEIKNDYCARNNIPLIRIPYYIKEIENYLSECLAAL